jgi:hypothetical protein
MSKPKAPTRAQLLYAAEAIFEARVIVERHLQLPEGSLDAKLRELEMGYYQQANQIKRSLSKPRKP